MLTLSSLCDVSRYRIKSKRLGRGMGSKKGKTCGRGQKGSGARSGYKLRLGNEGGQLELFRKLPCKGFTNGRFKVTYNVINLGLIEQMFEDGEVVNQDALRARGFISGGKEQLVKVLAKGEISKKVTIEADAISQAAQEKLRAAGISFTILSESENEQ